MSDAVFRTAAAPVTDSPGGETAAIDPAHVSDSHEASLFVTYEADQKRPFMADYFDVPQMWDKEEGMKRDMQEIEGYIREQVNGKKVDNSIKAAKEFIKSLEREAGLTRYEAVPQRISKILAYIDFRRVVNGDKTP